MTRKVAILGLGATGKRWSRIFHKAGWIVSAFDPDPQTDGAEHGSDWTRHGTISAAVRGVDWVVICLPERLDLLRTVIQRAQSEAPQTATIVSTSKSFGIEEVQACAIRPGAVIQVADGDDGGITLIVSSQNGPELRDASSALLPELAAVASLEDDAPPKDDQSDDAISA